MKYRNFYTTQETASMLQVSENTIYRMAKRGEVGATKVGRQWRFDDECIDKMKYSRKDKKW
tara:strand:- start:1880 stop:2062 length:183 start_codon:yes stop_codon:yes gene_type:complete